MRILLTLIAFYVLFSSCKQDNNIIESFDALSNFPQSDTVKVDMSFGNSISVCSIPTYVNKLSLTDFRLNGKGNPLYHPATSILPFVYSSSNATIFL